MTASQIVTPHHTASGSSYPPQHTAARRPGRPFTPPPAQAGVVRKAPIADADALTVADAVLELLRSVNRHAASH